MHLVVVVVESAEESWLIVIATLSTFLTANGYIHVHVAFLG
jgi:hypothetical protein